MAEEKNPKDDAPKMEKDKSVAGASGTPDDDNPLVTGVSHTRTKRSAEDISPAKGKKNGDD